MKKPELLEMDAQALERFLLEMGEPSYRAWQVYRWMHARAALSFSEMTDLPKRLRALLETKACITAAEETERLVDPEDGSVKFLLRLGDGEMVEAVLLRQPYGNSACVSTQAGCRMGCVFCASTLGGLGRNLTPGEMEVQVLKAHREVSHGGRGERVSHVVLMGIGEPLENYDNVLAFLRTIHSEAGLGISYRNVTLSTSGVVPGIRKLAGEGLPITLAVSLHAPNDELRNRLMPVNRHYPLKELIPACTEYASATRRRVTFEYALIDGVNDLQEHARELARLLRGLLCHVNLIPLNPNERGLKGSPPERIKEFAGVLEKNGLTVTVRRSLGVNIQAACGQLRRQRMLGATEGG